MAYVAIADRDHEQEHHDPQTFITKYVWSQDHKVIAMQYGCTAILVGLIALGLSAMMRLQLGFPGRIQLHQSGELLPVHHDAWNDHGDLSADGIVSRRLRKLPDPAHVRFARHGVSVLEYAQLLGVSAVCHHSHYQFLRTGRRDRRRLDAVPTAGDHAGHAGHRSRHYSDAGVIGGVYRGVYDGRPELRHDGAAGTVQGYDDDAYAVVGLGHFHRDHSGFAGVPGPFG